MKKILTVAISTALCITALSGCGTPRQIITTNEIQTTATEASNKFIKYADNTYTINLPKSKQTIKVDLKYNSYMLHVREDVLKEAEENIYSKIDEPSFDILFYLDSRSNYLYLMAEAIIYIDHPEGEGGCNISHKHVFFEEPIAYKE